MSNIRKTALVWFFSGLIYMLLEGIWRGGWTHICMAVIGGLCCVAVGAVNQIPRFYKAKIIWQSLIGAAIVLVVEFISGCIVNLWWGWGIWDYAGRFGNVLGQVCIPYALLWVALIPLAIWLEDTIAWVIWAWHKARGKTLNEPGIPLYSLKSIYIDLLTGR